MDVTGILFLAFVVWGVYSEKKEALKSRKGATRW